MNSLSASDRNQRAFRGVAAFILIFGHMVIGPVYSMGFASADHFPALSGGLLFYFLVVEAFLILSGCLLTLSYWEHFKRETPSREMDRFYIRRLARIYPLHLFTTVLIGLFAITGIPHPISSGLQDGIFRHWEWTGLLNLVLMQGWGIVPVASWNEPSWTLSVLFLLYILFPNLVLGLRRLPQKPATYLTLLALIFLGYFILRQMVELGSHSDGAGGLARGVVMFLAGMCIARLHMLGWAQGLNWDRLLGLFLIGLPVCILLWHGLGPFDMLPFQVIIACLVLCVLRAEGCISRLFANRVTCGLGVISFSLYLMHYPLSLLGTHYLGTWLHGLAQQGAAGVVGAYMIALSLLIAGSTVAYYTIEKPAAHLAGHWLRRKK